MNTNTQNYYTATNFYSPTASGAGRGQQLLTDGLLCLLGR